MNTENIRLEANVVVIAGEHILFLQSERNAHAWSLPGGVLGEGERFEEVGRRALVEQTGIRYADSLIQVGIFDDPRRLPGGGTRAISSAYLAVLSGPPPSLRLGPGVVEARWFHKQSLPALALDHKAMVEQALPRIKPARKQLYHVQVFKLIPPHGGYVRFTEDFSAEEAEQKVRRIEGIRDGDTVIVRKYDPERDGIIGEGMFIE
jgi:ADP-ribose pyrophosphatase YjhB (NUDIX family)